MEEEEEEKKRRRRKIAHTYSGTHCIVIISYPSP